MGKVLSIFIDESGDVGFIKDYPIFHAGPIIRREYPFDNVESTKETFHYKRVKDENGIFKWEIVKV